MLGERLHLVLRERPDHQRREEAREDESGIAIRLATRELELGCRQEERHPSELGDPDLERDACSRGRLVKDEPDRPAREKPELAAPQSLRLELVGEVEHRRQLVR